MINNYFKIIAMIALILITSLGYCDKNKCSSHFISIAPYLGIDETALVTVSLYNQDLVLLQQRQKLVKYKPDILKCPPGIIELSGMAAGLSKKGTFQFDSSEIDFAGHINNWVTTFFDFNYNDQPASTVGQIGNTKINLDRIFITLGNLNKSPYYLTLGRRYVPFSQYYSYTITGPIGR